MDIEQEAREVIEQGYDNIEEGDELITITERGLKKAIPSALRRVRREAYEDAIRIVTKADEVGYVHWGHSEIEQALKRRLNELEGL